MAKMQGHNVSWMIGHYERHETTILLESRKITSSKIQEKYNRQAADQDVDIKFCLNWIYL